VGHVRERGPHRRQLRAGRYTLETRNLPLLTTLLSLPTAFETPFKAEVYIVTTRQFTDLMWGTRHPLILRDPELGPVRLRGYGSYALRISDPPRLIRELSGSSGIALTGDLQAFTTYQAGIALEKAAATPAAGRPAGAMTRMP